MLFGFVNIKIDNIFSKRVSRFCFYYLYYTCNFKLLISENYSNSLECILCKIEYTLFKFIVFKNILYYVYSCIQGALFFIF